MIFFISFLFLALITFAVRYLQIRKQMTILMIEAKFGIDIESEKQKREKLRIKTNLFLFLVSFPFALSPFVFFVFSHERAMYMEMLPVFSVAWGLVYFWFASEQYNVFSDSITYVELLSEDDLDYFKRSLTILFHPNKKIQTTQMEDFLVIREKVRVVIEMEKQQAVETNIGKINRLKTEIKIQYKGLSNIHNKKKRHS